MVEVEDGTYKDLLEVETRQQFHHLKEIMVVIMLHKVTAAAEAQGQQEEMLVEIQEVLVEMELNHILVGHLQHLLEQIVDITVEAAVEGQ